jgi:hypothetical protein
MDEEKIINTIGSLAAIGVTAGVSLRILDEALDHGHRVHKHHYDNNPFKTRKIL